MVLPMPDIISILAGIGLGGVVGAYFQSHFERRRQVGQHQHELKQKRYFCIVMLLIAKLDPDDGVPKLRLHRPDLQTIADLDNELATELWNAHIFADDKVLETFSAFIRKPGRVAFLATVRAMRTDLWGKRSRLGDDLLSLIPDKLAK